LARSRIEVQQGKRFGLHNGVESVPLLGLDAFGAGDASALDIKFDAVALTGASIVTSLSAVPCPTGASITEAGPAKDRRARSFFPSLSGSGE
jgi:hypothetical protein